MRYLSLFVILLSWHSLQATELSSMEILHRADTARGNVLGITWHVTLQTHGQRSDKRMELYVQGRGYDIHARTLKPARSKNDLLLKVKGNMWFYKPGLSKPVPISRRQKLLGDAAYGDIAATNYAEEYEIINVAKEPLNGIPCYVFDLKAITKDTTYESIKYWVEIERLVGVRAEYFTVSGKLFKSATMDYENQVQIDNKPHLFLSSIQIRNELIDNHTTRLSFDKIFLGAVPDAIFNLNLLSQ